MTEPADLRVVDPVPGVQFLAVDRNAWIAAGQALAQSRSGTSWEFAAWLAAAHQPRGKEDMRVAAEATGATPKKSATI